MVVDVKGLGGTTAEPSPAGPDRDHVGAAHQDRQNRCAGTAQDLLCDTAVPEAPEAGAAVGAGDHPVDPLSACDLGDALIFSKGVALQKQCCLQRVTPGSARSLEAG